MCRYSSFLFESRGGDISDVVVFILDVKWTTYLTALWLNFIIRPIDRKNEYNGLNLRKVVDYLLSDLLMFEIQV